MRYKLSLHGRGSQGCVKQMETQWVAQQLLRGQRASSSASGALFGGADPHPLAVFILIYPEGYEEQDAGRAAAPGIARVLQGSDKSSIEIKCCKCRAFQTPSTTGVG